jgi:hypothetical protein
MGRGSPSASILPACPTYAPTEETESFHTEWLDFPVAFIFAGTDPDRPPLVVELRAGDSPVTMESTGGEVQFRPGPAPSPDLVLTGPPPVVVGLLSGRLDQKQAEDLGASVLGDLQPLARLRRADWLRGPEAAARPVKPEVTSTPE